jgi:hypothetical protein
VNALLQIPKPGIFATYRLVWVPDIPAFAVVESAEEVGKCVEWWLPEPMLPAFTERHPTWDGPAFAGPHYLIEVTGVLSERGRYGPNGDHVRQIIVQSYGNPEALPCR